MACLEGNGEAAPIGLCLFGAKRLPPHPGSIERYNGYDKRTVFDYAAVVCATAHRGAHGNFDLFRSWLAARVRGPARWPAAGGAGGGKPAISSAVSESSRGTVREGAIELRAEPGASGFLDSVSLARRRLRAFPRSRHGRLEPGEAAVAPGGGDKDARLLVRRHPAHEPGRCKSSGRRGRATSSATIRRSGAPASPPTARSSTPASTLEWIWSFTGISASWSTTL